ncbi:MAG TPA: nucleotidyltransferase [Bacillales bacterium]|nr:nucleotidyltransferase [Bacillales bacterium]
MKAVGVIVEYNPFHNGHYYHLQQSVQKSDANVVIAVMSGSFLQRGEPALVSKWQRTKMALAGGVDVVVELPYAFSTGKAEIFANGAISLLTELGADIVSFGSENGSIEPFETTIEFLDNHEQAYNETLKTYLAEGCSYPKAASLAFQKLTPDHSQLVDLSKPNNILGFHYVKAIKDQNSPIRPQTIARTGADYHDRELGMRPIASATGIRTAIVEEGKPLESVKRFVPDFTYQILEEFRNRHRHFNSWEQLFPYLKFRLLTSRPHELAALYEAEEGLEHRLQSHSKQAETFDEFMNRVKTKRYTWTRLQRFCVHLLTATTKTDMENIINKPRATYIRLLGMSDKGRDYLNAIKKDLRIPLVSTVSRFENPLLELDIRASDCYALGYSGAAQTELLAAEYATPPIQWTPTS